MLVKRYVCLIAFLLVQLIVGQSWALDGAGWRGLSSHDKFVYMRGVIDGWHDIKGITDIHKAYQVTEEQEEAKQKLSMLLDFILRPYQCMVERHYNDMQMIALANRYIEATPEEWQANMASLFGRAIEETCKKSP